MRLSRRTLFLVVGLAAVDGLLLAGNGVVADLRVGDSLVAIRERYLPKMRLGPKLDAELERIRRGFQDAVAAQDPEVLSGTHMALDEVSEMLAAAQPSVPAADAAAVRNAFKTYYTAGIDVSRRLMANESGEQILQAIQEMQAHEKRTSELIARVTAVDADELDRAFAGIVTAQRFAAGTRLLIIIAFQAVIVAVAIFLARRLRGEELRNTEIMQGAWRELETFSAPRPEHGDSIDLAQLVRDGGTLLKSVNPGRTVELTVGGEARLEIETALARALVDALLQHAWKATAGVANAKIEFGQTRTGGQDCYFLRSNGGTVDDALTATLSSAQHTFGSVAGRYSELATAQRVVRRCGGRIWAEKLAPSGVSIFFTLPAPLNRSS